MSWLIAHIWLLLSLAALFGGLIGWSLRRYLHGEAYEGLDNAEIATSAQDLKLKSLRIQELETQLTLERGEIEELRSQLSPELTVSEDADDSGLAWRNRYLESRVRFLEGRVHEIEGGHAPIVTEPKATEEEMQRLVWRSQYLEGRVRYLEEELSKGNVLEVMSASVSAGGEESGISAVEGNRPLLLAEARNGQPDDLKEIAGVGPKLESVLNGLGVFHFDQIAAWTDAEVAWVNSSIGSFRGRIERENWIDQARQLAEGVETPGKKAYKEGRHT